MNEPLCFHNTPCVSWTNPTSFRAQSARTDDPQEGFFLLLWTFVDQQPCARLARYRDI